MPEPCLQMLLSGSSYCYVPLHCPGARTFSVETSIEWHMAWGAPDLPVILVLPDLGCGRHLCVSMLHFKRHLTLRFQAFDESHRSESVPRVFPCGTQIEGCDALLATTRW